MLHIVLTLAIWDGSAWSAMQAGWIFRKQDSCQYVANEMIKKFKERKPEWDIYWACTERTNV